MCLSTETKAGIFFFSSVYYELGETRTLELN